MTRPSIVHAAGEAGSERRDAAKLAPADPASPAAVGRLTSDRRAALMRHSLGQDASAVTFREPVRVPESLEVDCRCASDQYLGREAELIAHHSGLSARVLNHQRERHDDRRPAVETVARMLWGGRALGWGFDRLSILARPILSALGADAAPQLPVVGRIGVVSAASSAIRKANEAIAAGLDAVRDERVTDRELAELTDRIQRAIADLHRLQSEAEAANGKVQP